MKAAVFDGKDISIKEVSRPEPSESQALIKIKAACSLTQ